MSLPAAPPIETLGPPVNVLAPISDIAARLGVPPHEKGGPATLVVEGRDGRHYDIWAVVGAFLDRLDRAALPPEEPELPPADPTEIDEAGVAKVTALVEAVRSAGLTEAAEMFSTVYWAWLRVIGAYVNAHPYVAQPEEPNMTPISALSVTDYTINHWSPQIPGTPKLDDKAVLEAAAADEAWHREEDRRMRRDAGECC